MSYAKVRLLDSIQRKLFSAQCHKETVNVETALPVTGRSRQTILIRELTLNSVFLFFGNLWVTIIYGYQD